MVPELHSFVKISKKGQLLFLIYIMMIMIKIGLYLGHTKVYEYRES